MRVIFCGTLCTFSTAPLRLLIEAGHDLCAVMIPSDQIDQRPPDRAAQPAATERPFRWSMRQPAPSIVSIAWEHQIPIYQVNRLAAARNASIRLRAAASRCRLRGLLSQTRAARAARRAALGFPERSSLAAAALSRTVSIVLDAAPRRSTFRRNDPLHGRAIGHGRHRRAGGSRSARWRLRRRSRQHCSHNMARSCCWTCCASWRQAVSRGARNRRAAVTFLRRKNQTS